MKKVLLFTALLLLANSCQGQKINSSDRGSGPARAPQFAGQFYPADSTKLSKAIAAFLNDAKPAKSDHPLAIIVPHAGYIFSGQIAADGYNQVKGNRYDLVVILGTNHTTAGFTGISVYPKGSFDTPIGSAAVDDSAAAELMKSDRDVTANPAVHEREHSIEVQIPFVKYLFPHAKIIPVVVGEPDADMCVRFGRALAGILKDKRSLIVASSDLSHYPRFDDALSIDHATLTAIESMDIDRIESYMSGQLRKNTPQLSTCACGEAPIMAAIAAAKELGANYASTISYTNSGYSPVGRADQVVGYGAVVIGRGKLSTAVSIDTTEVDPFYKLTSSDKEALLSYARRTIEQILTTETVPLPRNLGACLKVRRGAFVTLKKNGELRGCIGSMSGDRPLGTVVGAMALQAAFNDTRFDPLGEQELPRVEIEISALTPFTEVKSADEVVLGRDGVVVRKGNRQAVFLPQVATETGWSKEVFLDQLCYKAGLEKGDWKTAQLFTFQADVFSESEFGSTEHR